MSYPKGGLASAPAGSPPDLPLAALRRGGLAESVHRGRYVFAEPSGNLLDALGDPEGYFFPRSSLKPFQAMPLVLSGAADAFGLSEEELAVACGSHFGEERHVAAIRSLLDKAGLTEDDLQNGPHPPIHAPSAKKLGEDFGRIHGNCSGKHAGMLAVCAHEGWKKEDYLSPEHPVQQWILSIVSEFCDVESKGVLIGGDGCGAPAFAVPLKSFAVGFARFVSVEGVSDELVRGAVRLRDAVRGHPFTISGSEGFDTEVMEKTNLLVKGGAEGVWAAGSEEGWGFALKVSDGAGRAVRSAAVRALGRRGIETGASEKAPVRDLNGEVVGEVAPVEGLEGGR